MVDRPLIALTGATGFVGRQLLRDLTQNSVPVRALARMQPHRKLTDGNGIEWISGDLSSDAALSSLVRGTDTVIHLAGATKARDASVFREVNALRTAELVRRAQAAGVQHFVHVSSLTASRPDISAYAKSKAESEILAAENAGSMALTIVRAPAILGPGDDATRSLFSALARGILPVPGGAAGAFRFSVIDVLDTARFLMTLANSRTGGIRTLSPASHLNLGWSDIAQSAERVTAKRMHRIVFPAALMKMAGHGADLAVKLGATPQVFSRGKVDELLSGDWIGDTQVPNPIPLDETLERCLAPFLRSARGLGEQERSEQTDDLKNRSSRDL